MSTDTTTCASVPHWEASGYLRNISGVIVGEHGHAELRQALQGAAQVRQQDGGLLIRSDSPAAVMRFVPARP